LPVGVTAIKRIENRSSGAISVVNIENPSSSGSGTSVAPGQTISADMWIPWAAQAGDFPKHHLEVNAQWGKVCVWQANRSDGDQVRVSTDGAWHDPGSAIAGSAWVDGDRRLTIFDGFPYLTYNLSGTTGTLRVPLQKVGASAYLSDFVKDPAPGGPRILRLRNATAIPLYLSHSVPGGNTPEVYAAGNGLVEHFFLERVTTQWFARAASGTPPASAELEIRSWPIFAEAAEAGEASGSAPGRHCRRRQPRAIRDIVAIKDHKKVALARKSRSKAVDISGLSQPQRA